MDYPLILSRDDNGTVLVDFPDFPEAHTFGKNEVDALRRAPDALATVIDGYIRDRRDIPLPSAKLTKWRVTMPALVKAKVGLYEAMRASKIGKSELARRLDWHLPQVDRLFEMTHASKLEQLESAFRVLGKRLVVTVEDQPAVADMRPRRRRAVRGQTHRRRRRVATPRR